MEIERAIKRINGSGGSARSVQTLIQQQVHTKFLSALVNTARRIGLVGDEWRRTYLNAGSKNSGCPTAFIIDEGQPAARNCFGGSSLMPYLELSWSENKQGWRNQVNENLKNLRTLIVSGLPS